MPTCSRRSFLKAASAAAAVSTCTTRLSRASAQPSLARPPKLSTFAYGDVTLMPGRAQAQLDETHAVLMGLNLDDLLRPFRVREGMTAPGSDLGGWYDAFAFAPAHAYGQWMSALARSYAITGDPATQARVHAMVAGYASTLDPEGRFWMDNRFPAYTYDKLTIGLIDAHSLAHDPMAQDTLRRATTSVRSFLPPKALTRPEMEARPHRNISYCWDESYTLPENQFLAWQRTGDPAYRTAGERYLLNAEYFDPLARGENVLPDKHAYSHVNALSSAAQAYMVLGDDKYLKAAQNGFQFVLDQSFATGGWGPAERFRVPGSGDLGNDLTDTHASFETPCGSYAHFKIARYLMQITGSAQYGDSMERVLYNTVLGAKTLEPDGHAFYYSDYSYTGRKEYHPDRWPCCAGTLPQVAADYRISTYLRDRDGVYVNLYLPSTVRWQQGSTQCSLAQSGDYPYSSDVRFQVAVSRPAEFALRFRIPAWAQGAQLRVNGKPVQAIAPRSFAAVQRTWQDGDRVELTLPLTMRLEAVDAQHPKTVALMRGPVVFFALTDTMPKITVATIARGADRRLMPTMRLSCKLRTARCVWFRSHRFAKRDISLICRCNDFSRYQQRYKGGATQSGAACSYLPWQTRARATASPTRRPRDAGPDMSQYPVRVSMKKEAAARSPRAAMAAKK